MQRFNWRYQIRLRLKQWFGLLWLREKLKTRPAILVYHGLMERHLHPEVEAYFLEVEVFKAHLRYLEANYQIVSLPKLMDGLTGSKSLPQKWVAISFDDGLANTVHIANKLLTRRKLPWGLAICPGLIESQRSVWSYELAFLLWVCWKDNALSIEHPTRVRLPTTTPDERRQALSALRQICFQQSSHEDRMAVLDQLIAQVGPVVFDEAMSRYGELRLASWPELKQIAREHVELVAHGCFHCPQNDAISETAQLQEFAGAHSILKCCWPGKEWGFALPHGLSNGRTVPLCQEFGYSYCLTSTEAPLTARPELLALPRYDASWDCLTLRDKLLR